MMRNLPLAIKIWGVFAGVTLAIFILLGASLPWLLNGFFTQQLYDILLSSQKAVQFTTADQAIRLQPAAKAAAGFSAVAASTAISGVVAADASAAVPGAEAGPAVPGAVAADADAAVSGAKARAVVPGAVTVDTSEAVPSAAAGPTVPGTVPFGAVTAISGVTAGAALPGSAAMDIITVVPGDRYATTAAPASPASTVIIGPKIAAAGSEAAPLVTTDWQQGTEALSKIAIRKIVDLPQPVEPVVQHMVMLREANQATAAVPLEVHGSTLPQPFLTAVEKDAESQGRTVQTYARKFDDKTMFYVISKNELEGKPGYMVSYSWDSYSNGIAMALFGRMVLLMVLIVVLSLLPCYGLARYLTRPLVSMEKRVERMADRDWHEPFETTGRKDEIGKLARAFEAMRQRLVLQDKAQQFVLQNISHELKTPVMVIRSYAQSIMDGIFPKGSLEGSLETIMSETGRLEKRIRDLLYLNKISYMTTREKQFVTFSLKEQIADVVERLRFNNPAIEWRFEMADFEYSGSKEQWNVALENVLDNQLRFARTRIAITGGTREPEGGGVKTRYIRIWNDGELLEEGAGKRMFQTFRTGTNGQFGLGLAIVQQIADYHEATVRAVNEDNGVAFYFEWTDNGAKP